MKTIYQSKSKATLENLKFFVTILLCGTLFAMLFASQVNAQTLAALNPVASKEHEVSKENSFAKGMKAVAGKDDKSAIVAFTAALTEGANKAEIYNQRGRAYGRMNDFKRAMADFTSAIALDSNQADYYYHRALAANKAGKYSSCIRDCDKAIQKNNTFAEAYLVRGIAKALEGDATGSMPDFRQALACRPDYAEAYYNIGLNYYEANDDVNARKYLLEAKKHGFENPELASYLKK